MNTREREREQNVCYNKQENVLIIGVDSQIGSALKNHLTIKKITVFGTTRKKERANLNTYYFDLEKPNFEIFTNKFTSVVVCAATTNIAECEKEPQKHKAINVTNTIKTIEKLAQNNSFIIYLSSNAVFNGEKAFYKNNDKTCPTTLYGKFKTEVEEYLTTKLEINSCVLRLTKVITKNTPFIERWKNEANAGKSIKTFTNKFLSPVDIENVVDNIQLLIEQKRTGIYQYGGSEEISYTEYAKRYFQNDKSALELISAETENTKNKIAYNSLSTHLPIECLACHSNNITKLGINYVNCVTSDCQPIKFNPQLFICNKCNLIQKKIDSQFIEVTNKIYNDYKIYDSANGEEQSVFTNTGSAASRSSKIIEFILNKTTLEDSGSMLEIGCGNGSFIKTFSSLKPNWKLAGTEFDDRNKFKIEKIKNTTFFSGNFTQINSKYDLIVCIHVLEHIYSPSEFLMNCDLMLNTNGKILIQVPNIDKSPFDIFIADHCSHFSIESLSRLVIKSGLRILEITSSVVDKEITLLIEKNNNEKHIQITSTYYYDFLNLVTRIDRLFLEEKFILGIFGSSIAATMLYSSLTSKINFFVDEDVNKIGNNHFNIPIISVDEIPKNSIVVLPMSNENAISISNRLKNKNFRFLY